MLDPYTTKRRLDALMVLVILGLFALAAGINWLIMVLFGVVHSFWEVIPAFGFWQTAVIWLLVTLITSSASASVKR